MCPIRYAEDPMIITHISNIVDYPSILLRSPSKRSSSFSKPIPYKAVPTASTSRTAQRKKSFETINITDDDDDDFAQDGKTCMLSNIHETSE